MAAALTRRVSGAVAMIGTDFWVVECAEGVADDDETLALMSEILGET